MNLNDDPGLALRLPPASIESESSVLGGLLLDNTAWERVGDLLKDDDFYRYEHKLVFAAVAALLEANKPADVITVNEHLQNQGKADEIGGLIYLNSLAQYVPSAANIRRYAEIVRERSLSRKLMATGAKINDLALDHGRGIAERIDDASGQLAQLLEGGPRRDDWQEPDEGMVDFLEGIDSRARGEKNFIPTGLTDLDELLDGGMRPGEVLVIAARPSMGKTALAVTIGENVADGGHSVGMMSMEMPKAQVQSRRIAIHSGIPLHKLKRPERMSDYDWRVMSDTVEKIRRLPVFISDQTGLTINHVRSKARALKRRRGLRVLIIDYIGLMEGTDRKANRATQLGEVSRGLKNLAKELGITILLLAQLNREVEKRTNMRPILADLRECGDIEQDADVIVFVHRPAHVKPDLGPEWKHYAELIVSKNRDGMTGDVHAHYTGDTVHFCNWDGEKPVSHVRTRGGDL